MNFPGARKTPIYRVWDRFQLGSCLVFLAFLYYAFHRELLNRLLLLAKRNLEGELPALELIEWFLFTAKLIVLSYLTLCWYLTLGGVRSWLKPCPYLTPKTGYAAKKRKSLSLGSTFDFSFRESSESRTRALRKSRRSWQVDSHSLGYETLLPISKRNGLTRASSKLTIL